MGHFYVYKVTCRDTAKVYVGKTKNPLARRWREHKNAARRGATLALSRALRKYGADRFSIEPIERMTTEAGAYRAEQLWIAQLNCVAPHGYNLDAGGLGLSGPSVETKSRMSESATRKWETNPELRAKAAKTLRQFPCRKQSEETKAKIRAARAIQAPRRESKSSPQGTGFTTKN